MRDFCLIMGFLQNNKVFSDQTGISQYFFTKKKYWESLSRTPSQLYLDSFLFLDKYPLHHHGGNGQRRGQVRKRTKLLPDQGLDHIYPFFQMQKSVELQDYSVFGVVPFMERLMIKVNNGLFQTVDTANLVLQRVENVRRIRPFRKSANFYHVSQHYSPPSFYLKFLNVYIKNLSEQDRPQCI